MSYVWEHSKLGGTELLCLLAISDFADDKGIAFPSVETLSKKIRMSERNTQYIIKRLVASKELEVDQNAGKRGCNLFRVQCLRGCNPALKGVQPIAPGGVQAFAPEPSLEPSIEPSEYLRASFSRFWSAYPKRKSKGQAEKAWAKLKPNEQLTAEILSAVRRATTSVEWVNDGGKFIPHPATWLNAKGWEDEYQQPRKRSTEPDFATLNYREGISEDGRF